MLIFVSDARAISFEELHNDATLAPQTFARHFANFRYAFHADVQDSRDFLKTEAGDCDDYSTLAASELAARGYHPRLISIRMKNVVHVVCYIAESNGYLDYNKRSHGTGIVPCGPDLASVADSVGKSFKLPWSSVSEFTYNERVKRLVSTTVAKKSVG